MKSCGEVATGLEIGLAGEFPLIVVCLSMLNIFPVSHCSDYKPLLAETAAIRPPRAFPPSLGPWLIVKVVFRQRYDSVTLPIVP